MHDHNMLYSDAQALMVGGTDTIAAALSFAFSHLARDPTIQKKLRAELEPLYGRTISGEFTNFDLGEAEAKYLNAVINETMSLDNPTCANGPRITPPEGLEVDGVFIPGEVLVYTPIHAMHRSEYLFDYKFFIFCGPKVSKEDIKVVIWQILSNRFNHDRRKVFQGARQLYPRTMDYTA